MLLGTMPTFPTIEIYTTSQNSIPFIYENNIQAVLSAVTAEYPLRDSPTPHKSYENFECVTKFNYTESRNVK